MAHVTVVIITVHLLMIFTVPSSSIEPDIDAVCDDHMTVCTCPDNARACSFKLTVQQILTFTRYQIDAPPGSQGEVYFINATGQLESVSLTQTVSCDDVNCTEANTVDGRTFRSFYAINGRIPGPTLIMHENQIVVADVENLLSEEGISFHWHGMHQRNTPWMDGIGFISQCPISPGASFRYIFKAYPPGTFWYHSHSGAQRTDGMYGALIVLESSTTIQSDLGIMFEDFPAKHTLSFLDWQREESLDLFTKVHSKIRYFPPPNDPVDMVPTTGEDFYRPSQAADGSGIGVIRYWAGLINGRGHHSAIPLNRSILSIFEVDEGKNYRFRLIGAQSVYAYNFSIDAHKLTVIATDGYFIQPVETDFVIIHTGERYDIIVSANQREQANYFIHAHTLELEFDSRGEAPFSLLSNEAIGILHYSRENPPTPPDYDDILPHPKVCSETSPCRAVNCPFQNFHPSYNIHCINVYELKLLYPTPDSELPTPPVNEEFIFNFAFENPQRTSTINGRNFIFPSFSLQTQTEYFNHNRHKLACKNKDTCEEGCHCLHVHDIPFDKTVRIVLSTVGKTMSRRRFSHPAHLHGHSFHVVGTGYGEYDTETGQIVSSSNDLVCSNGSTDTFCIKPHWNNSKVVNFTIDKWTVRKDTVIIPAGGYVVIQFLSDNPGFWFLHCHIEPHQLEGMALVINEAQAKQNPPPTGMEVCGNFTWSVEDYRKKQRYNPATEATHYNITTSNAAVIATILFGFTAIAFAFLLYNIIFRVKR